MALACNLTILPAYNIKVLKWHSACRNSLIADQYIIAYYTIIIVVYIVDSTCSVITDMWILFTFYLFRSIRNATTTQIHSKTVVDMAQIPGRIEISNTLS